MAGKKALQVQNCAVRFTRRIFSMAPSGCMSFSFLLHRCVVVAYALQAHDGRPFSSQKLQPIDLLIRQTESLHLDALEAVDLIGGY
jgi:hypothetical protein